MTVDPRYTRLYESFREHYPKEHRDEIDKLTLLYRNRGRDVVKEYLRRMGFLAEKEEYPIQTGVLRHIIGQLAVVYQSPPLRWLRRPGNGFRLGELLGDEHPAQAALWVAYERSKIDAVLREVDAYRTLWGMAIIRLYPSTVSQRVRTHVFPPSHVMRVHSPDDPDDFRADSLIGLKRADGTIEIWENLGQAWIMDVVDKEGRPVDGGAEIHSVLPIVPFYDGIAPGPYKHPSQHRMEYIYKISHALAESTSAIIWDAHPPKTYETPTNPSPIAKDEDKDNQPIQPLGPGMAEVLPIGRQLRVHQVQPQIQAINAAADFFISQWLMAESLPPDSYRQSQTVSALGLAQASKPLLERREALRPFVVEAEERLFEAYRAMHNEWAPFWDLPFMIDSPVLDLELGDWTVAADEKSESEQIARDIALGVDSRIDGIQRRRGLSRRQAIERHLRIQRDRELYGADERDEEPEEPPGPRLAQTNDAVRPDRTDSNTQAAQAEMEA